MSQEAAKGTCVGCGMGGTAMDACAAPGCKALGLHLIPEEYLSLETVGSADPMLGRMVDDHLVVSTVGSGGFGKVYLALQRLSGLKVALKMLHVHRIEGKQREMALRNFEREAQALASLTHPAIVRLIKYGVVEETPFLIMEYLSDTVRLDEEYRRRKTQRTWFSLPEIRSIANQLLFVLEHAHTKGIIHRDLKPDNVMLQRVNNNPLTVRLLDFGLAKHLLSGEQTQHIIGTPSYMAPEQIRGLSLSPATDLYTVAVMVMELLSGKKAFPAKGYEAVFSAKMDPAFDPTTILDALQLPGEVLAFFHRMLAPNPATRIQTAWQMRDELAQVLDMVENGASVGSDLMENTTEPVVMEKKEALLRWLSIEKKRLEERRKVPDDWDI